MPFRAKFAKGLNVPAACFQDTLFSTIFHALHQRFLDIKQGQS